MELITPCRDYYKSYIDAAKEYAENNVSTYIFLDYEKNDIFEIIENFRTGKNLKKGYIKATYLWLVDGDKFIGEVSIRHELTDALLRYGGNIGYGIRYSEWNKGIGTTMLSMALKYAKERLGLNRVLITCDDDNIGSARVIEKNRGILQDKIPNTIDGRDIITRRYWIDI